MTKKLLLIDDDVAKSVWFEQAVESMPGVEVKHCRDGRDAVNYLRSHPPGTIGAPAVVICDLMMPRLNGFEVLRELHRLANANRLPVVIFTQSIAEADIYLSYQFGASAFVIKPQQPGRLQKVARLTAEILAAHERSSARPRRGF